MRIREWWPRREHAAGDVDGDGGRVGAEPAPYPDDGLDAGALLTSGDGWSRASAGPRLDRARFKVLSTLLNTDHGPRPYRSALWRAQVGEYAAHSGRPARSALLHLLRTLAEATPSRESAGAAQERPLLVGRLNTVRAVNVVWAALALSAAEALPGREVLPLIERVLIRALTEPWTMDSAVRVRNAAENALVFDGGPLASRALAEAAPLAPTSALREQLAWSLAKIATETDEVPPSRLAELRISGHGLDAGGERQITVHRRRFTVKLRPDGRVALIPENPGEIPDQAAARVASAEVRALAGAYRAESRRIEDLLATEREWPLADWRRLYLEPALTRAVAGRLVWRLTLDDASTLDVLPGWNQEAVTAAGGQPVPVEWPDEASTTVRLWHPREADPSQLASWRGVAGRLSLRQPFQQIERDFTRVEPEAEAVELHEALGVVLSPAAFERGRLRVDWRSHQSGGASSDRQRYLTREFPDDHLSVSLNFVERGDEVKLGEAWFHRTERKSRTPLPLGSVSGRIYSETVRDLAVLARATEADGAQEEPEDSGPEDEIPTTFAESSDIVP